MEITTILLFDLGGTIEDIVLDLNSQDACIDVIQQFLQCQDNEFAIDRSLFHRIAKDGFLHYKQWSINSCRNKVECTSRARRIPRARSARRGGSVAPLPQRVGVRDDEDVIRLLAKTLSWLGMITLVWCS